MKAHLATKFGDKVEFSNTPVEVPKDEGKPFEVKVNDKVVYSHLAPIDGEKGPILFEANKWWGEPNPAYIARVESAIEAA